MFCCCLIKTLQYVNLTKLSYPTTYHCGTTEGSCKSYHDGIDRWWTWGTTILKGPKNLDMKVGFLQFFSKSWCCCTFSVFTPTLFLEGQLQHLTQIWIQLLPLFWLFDLGHFIGLQHPGSFTLAFWHWSFTTGSAVYDKAFLTLLGPLTLWFCTWLGFSLVWPAAAALGTTFTWHLILH